MVIGTIVLTFYLFLLIYLLGLFIYFSFNFHFFLLAVKFHLKFSFYFLVFTFDQFCNQIYRIAPKLHNGLKIMGKLIS